MGGEKTLGEGIKTMYLTTGTVAVSQKVSIESSGSERRGRRSVFFVKGGVDGAKGRQPRPMPLCWKE